MRWPDCHHHQRSSLDTEEDSFVLRRCVECQENQSCPHWVTSAPQAEVYTYHGLVSSNFTCLAPLHLPIYVYYLARTA